MPLMPGAEPYHADGGPVGALVLHGFTGMPESVRPWAQHLADAGLTVRLPRLPGHGTRWQELNRTRWEDWYGEAERAFDDLRGRCDSVFVMGLSMGGTLTVRMAQHRGGDVDGIVMVNPSIFTLRKDAKLLPLMRLIVPAFPPIASDIKKEGVEEPAYDKLPLRAAYSLAQLWKQVQTELHKISQPMLVFTSKDDHVVEPENSKVLLEKATSPHKEHVVLENSYHVATMDHDAPLIFDRTLEFVKTHARTFSA